MLSTITGATHCWVLICVDSRFLNNSAVLGPNGTSSYPIAISDTVTGGLGYTSAEGGNVSDSGSLRMGSSAPSGSGGAVHLDFGTRMRFHDADFQGNSAEENGGAVNLQVPATRGSLARTRYHDLESRWRASPAEARARAVCHEVTISRLGCILWRSDSNCKCLGKRWSSSRFTEKK